MEGIHRKAKGGGENRRWGNPGQREKRRTNQTGEEEAKGRRWIREGRREEGRKEGRKEMVVEVGECRAIRAKGGGEIGRAHV